MRLRAARPWAGRLLRGLAALAAGLAGAGGAEAGAAEAGAASCPPYLASAAPEVTCHLVPSGTAVIQAYRVPASKAGAGKLPILVLGGGPATRISINLAGLLAWPTLAALRAKHELVLLDSRGSWPSRPGMTCPALFSWRAPEPLDAGAVSNCAQIGAQIGWGLDALGSAAAAADVAAVRAAFGIGRWAVLAVSWDARVAVQLAALEPGRIAALLLHAPAALDGAIYDARYAAQRVAVLGRMVDDCAAQPRCAGAYPRFGDVLDGMFATLRAIPRVVDLPRGDGTRVRFRLTADAAAAALLGQTATHALPTVPQVAHALAALVADGAALPDTAAPLFGVSQPLLASVAGLPFAVQVCAAQRGAEPLGDVAARLGPRAAIWPEVTLLSICPALPGPAKAEAAVPVPDVPMLILLGRYDANVPEAPALALAAARPATVRAVVLSGAGHRVGDNRCAARLSAAFIDNPAAALDAGCASEPAGFVTHRGWLGEAWFGQNWFDRT